MPSESERSSEQETEGSRGERLDRGDDRDRSIETTGTTDTVSATPDAAAIEAARARALASGAPREEESSEEEKTVFDFAKDAGSRVGKVGKGGLEILGGSLVVAGYLGYQTSRPVLFTAAHALDWIGQKMNSWADKLIDKKLPILNWFINPVVSLLDTSAKSLGIDKTLAEHLRKNAKDRKKLAEKVFKDYMEAQKKAEKKVDDAAEKAKRRKVIEDKLGPDVAGAIIDDVDAVAATAAAAAEPAVAEPAAAPPAEAPNAA